MSERNKLSKTKLFCASLVAAVALGDAALIAAIAFAEISDDPSEYWGLYQLNMSVEIARHCEREPGHIFDLAKNPEDNFTVPYNCTMTGVKHH